MWALALKRLADFHYRAMRRKVRQYQTKESQKKSEMVGIVGGAYNGDKNSTQGNACKQMKKNQYEHVYFK